MRVELDQITKTFGKVHANEAVSLTLEGGRIYAVLGENGAGKSTLMKILSGYQPPDSGEILVNKKPAAFNTPADALARGVGMLHQDPLDVPSLTVLENFLLGEPGGVIPDRGKAQESLQKLSARLGFDLRPDAYVDTLTIGERQQLEIVRLLSRGARLLILDEPTTGISADQKDALFGSLRQLAHDEGLTVVLVSHKLQDVEALCDEVYVLRQGCVVGNAVMPCPASQLVAMMFGKEIESLPREPALPKGKGDNTALRVRSLSVPGRRVTLKHINFSLDVGEVLGLAGLDGSGQSAFLRACAGLQKPTSGWVYLSGVDVTHVPFHNRAKLGIAYTSAGRLEEGLVNGLTLAEHYALTGQSGGRVNWKAANKQAEDRIAHFNIRGRPDSPIQTLSGGNQQRTLLSLLPPNLKLLLLENPTRGLDVESSRWVWTQLLARRAQGTAIVFTSPDLDEIMQYSDQIAVFFGGQVTLVGHPSETTITELGHMIGGHAK